MGLLVGFVLHIIAVYLSTKIARLENADWMRSILIAFFGGQALSMAGYLTARMVTVPVPEILLAVIVLGGITTVAARLLIPCDWKPAWLVGSLAATITSPPLGLLIGGRSLW